MIKNTVRAIGASLIVAMIFLAACSDKTTEPQGSDGIPSGKVTDYTTCKDSAMAAGRGEIPNDRDCIEYAYDGQSVLTLTHINAGFNCCPDSLMAAFHIGSGDIIIDEAELLTSGGCHCLCLYDLDYEIRDLPPGEYIIRVNQPYLASRAAVLEFSVDLASQPSGTVCVERDFDPWGGE